MSLSLVGAAQVLRPPEDGLPYVRGDRAGELRLEPGSVTVAGGRVVALDGDAQANVVVDAAGGAILPGLVDCHTHLPFAGWRAEEYELKVTGVPYEEIARRGGGIRASARALAQTPDDAVLDQAAVLAAERIRRTLLADPGMGIIRHADAGYDEALAAAERHGVRIPMRG